MLVLDKHGRPLQPCTPARARTLLGAGRAVVHRHTPFVVRLKDRTIEQSTIQGAEVGIDPGSKATGIAMFTAKEGNRAGLFAIEVRHRGGQIRDKLTARAGRRRGRRSRNLRYRAPRFTNRARPTGWLAPSLRHRVETTMSWVTRLLRWAPITRLHVERVAFDTQLLQDPNVSGVAYQSGELAGYEIREYLLEKWKRRCAYCQATNVPLNSDHIEPRSRGGSDRVSNLTLACIPCNQEKGSLPVEVFLTDRPAVLARIRRQAKAPLRDAAAATSTRWALWSALTGTGLPVRVATGGRTKWNRHRTGAPKTHTLDAMHVGELASMMRWPSTTMVATSAGRGSYSRARTDRYGFPRLRLPRTKRVHGFATGDLVRAVVPTGVKRGTHTGRVAVRSTGRFNIRTSAGLIQGIDHRHVRLLQRADGWAYTRRPEPARA
ncbi:RNA-guided endonuclease IscB [Paractinoplanes atraurantiacus]|uniref:HNH endonuclease n=1 Tax=Paractinoplanes atraurantiacus TaxID=1036182 RepID=A0A285IQA8_9ACTN|nr:RNA-guided endonuclease IscB [Actinoplanes atraurantiacus]SNY50210.1 HNH endonuclease [Actinoplanes atraurantiacus]